MYAINLSSYTGLTADRGFPPRRKNIAKLDTLIMGAGVSGLAAADRLCQRGESPVIIEKAETAGGLCRTIRRDGFVFDMGGHRFLTNNKNIQDYVCGLFSPDELDIRQRKSQIFLNEKHLMYPPEFIDILKTLGVWTCMNCAADSIFFRLKHAILNKPEITLKDWIINRFGHKLYNMYFGPYSYKLWGRKSSTISRDWAPQRISVSGIEVALRNLFIPGGTSLKTYSRKFFYPVGGIGKIPYKISKSIMERGGKIFLDNSITGISIEPGCYIIKTITSKGEKKIFSTSRVISTIPLTEVLKIITPPPPDEVIDAVSGLTFRSVRFMNLMLDSKPLTSNTWMYIPESKYIFFRIQEFPNWHPANAPAGKTSLTLEIACDKDDRIWDMDDKELLSICINDLKKMGLHLEDKVINFFSTFAEHAYPVYSLGYRKNLQKIYGYVRGLKNFVVGGRQGLFRYLNIDSAIKTGFDAAESLYNGDSQTSSKIFLFTD